MRQPALLFTLQDLSTFFPSSGKRTSFFRNIIRLELEERTYKGDEKNEEVFSVDDGRY